ncbi:MAG: ankyrin repeat domain-containing protein [Brachymonas sp.]
MTQQHGTDIPADNDELVTLYRQAAQLEDVQPGAHVRATVLAAAQQAAARNARAGSDVSLASGGPEEPCADAHVTANDARWKIRALASFAVLGLVGLLASHFLPHTDGHEELTRTLAPAPYQTQAASAVDGNAARAMSGASSVAEKPAPVVRGIHSEAAPDKAQAPPVHAQENALPPRSEQVASNKVASVTGPHPPHALPEAPPSPSVEGRVTDSAAPFMADALVQPRPVAEEAQPETRAATDQQGNTGAGREMPQALRKATQQPSGHHDDAPSSGMAAVSEPASTFTPPSPLAERRAFEPSESVAREKLDGGELLLAAATRGDLRGVQQALQSGAFIDARDEAGRTALMRAAGQGHAPVVHYLLSMGADAALSDKAGRNAAAHARLAGHGALARQISGTP